MNKIEKCSLMFVIYLRVGRGDLERRRGGDRLGGEYLRVLYGDRREYDRRGGDLRRTGERVGDRDADLE